MALEIKQSVRLSQQLVVTPQLQQAIKLLQLSRIELADLIQNEMVENPCLEEASEVEEKTEQESNAELHEQAKNEDREAPRLILAPFFLQLQKLLQDTDFLPFHFE